jgi:hypothetical protein
MRLTELERTRFIPLPYEKNLELFSGCANTGRI